MASFTSSEAGFKRAQALNLSLECPSCGRTLQDPQVSTLCMHVACALCFVNMVCPVCQRPCSSTNLQQESRVRQALIVNSILSQIFPETTASSEFEADDEFHTRTSYSIKDISQRNESKLKGLLGVEQRGTPDGGFSKISPKASLRRSSSKSFNITLPLKVPSSNSRLHKRNNLGETILHVACKKTGTLDRVRELLLQGANPNTRDNAGWSPLHEVAQTGAVETAQLLIAHGAHVDSQSECGTRPLHDAIQAGYPQIVRLLLENGANPRAPNGENQTPLFLASHNKKIQDIIEEFLNKPATAFISKNSAPLTCEEKVPFQAAACSPHDSFGNPLPTYRGLSTCEALVNGVTGKALVLMSSSLRGTDLKTFKDCASALSARIVERIDKAPGHRVSHLVVPVDVNGNTQRTLKFLQCLASGRTWIVSIDWARQCLNERKHVDELSFEVQGCRQFPGCQAPFRARTGIITATIAASTLPGNADPDKKRDDKLLTGFCVYFAPPPRLTGSTNVPVLPSTDELIAMCQWAGAEIVEELPKTSLPNSRFEHAFISKPLPANLHVISAECPALARCRYLAVSSSSYCAPQSPENTNGVVLWVSRDWLIDSISRYKLVDPVHEDCCGS